MQTFLDKGEKYDVRQGFSKSEMEFSGPGAGMNPCGQRPGDRRPLSRTKPRPELVPTGQKYCEKHKKMHPEEARSASARGYGRMWQKASKAFLASHPLCEERLKRGKYTKAMVVDHIVPHRGDPKLFWDRNNWQALCKRCHDQKTGREDRNPTYRYGRES